VVRQHIIHSRRKQQETNQVRLASVWQLTKPQIIEKVIGKPYLFAAAFELAKVTEPEDLFHSSLRRNLGNVHSDGRNRAVAVGLQTDAAQLRNCAIIDGPFARTS